MHRKKKQNIRKQRHKWRFLLEMIGSCVVHAHNPPMSLLIWAKSPQNHCPSASGKGSSALEECLWGRACCWGWMGSASQCSMREEGGSRWPYLVPSLGGSRGGKKYLKQQINGWRRRRQIHGRGEDDDNGIQRGHTSKEVGKEALKGERMHLRSRNTLKKRGQWQTAVTGV